LVENMSYLTLPESGGRIDLFGPSHADAAAQAANAPLWARLPLDPQLNLLADCGSIETVNLPEVPALVDQLIYAVSLTGERSNGTPA
jgi:hypothetical protein